MAPRDRTFVSAAMNGRITSADSLLCRESVLTIIQLACRGPISSEGASESGNEREFWSNRFGGSCDLPRKEDRAWPRNYRFAGS